MEEVHKIYDDLKNQAKLYFPDMSKEFHLHADASDTGIGAVLHQKQGVIGCYSKKLNKAQSQHTVTKKELLAVKLAINHWEKWFIGSKILVYTDNKNLLGKGRDYDKKCGRWMAELGAYNITLNYIPDNENCVADYLSRFKPSEETLK